MPVERRELSASASLRTFVQRADIDGGVMDNANDSACLLLDFASGAHAVIHIGLPNIVGPGLSHTGQTVIISGHDGTLETRCDQVRIPSSPFAPAPSSRSRNRSPKM